VQGTIPNRPLLSPWHRIARDDRRVLFEHADTVSSFAGAAATTLLPALLPLLDGTRTVGEIVECLGTRVAPAIERALTALAGAGALTEGPAVTAEAPERARTALFLASQWPGDGPAAVLDRVSQSRVVVAGAGCFADAVAELLRQSGTDRIERTSVEELPSGTIDLLIAAPLARERGMLEKLNSAALERRLVWLPVLPFDGRHAVVGPLLVAGETCCYRCYVLRRASTSGYREEQSALVDVPFPELTPPALAAMISGLGATLALRWLGWRDPELPGRAHSLEQWPTVTVQVHTVHRVPRCPSCSEVDRFASPAPWFEATPE
jgi:bacteriocin biosynthesis cyclodehydratase domain-containing protein